MLEIRRATLTSIDELVDPIASMRGNPHIVDAGRTIHAEITSVSLDEIELQIFDYSFRVASHAQTLPGRMAVAIPLGNPLGIRTNGEPVTPTSIGTWGPAAEVTNTSAGPLSFAVLSLPEHAFDRAATAHRVALGLPGPGEFRHVVTADPTGLRDTLTSVAELARHQRSLDRTSATALHHELLELVIDALSSGLSPEVRYCKDPAVIVADCTEFAHSAHYASITIADLCEAAGVGAPQVRDAFRRCFGMSARAYLRLEALHAVRRQLLTRPDRYDAVTRVATEYGFWHLGRFAGQYRALFGEAPSETVRRVRGSRLAQRAGS